MARRPPIPRDLRFHIYGRDRFRCRYCAVKVRFKTGTLDHVIPWSDGGPSEEFNLVCCCYPCNRRKKDKYLFELGWVLLPPGTRIIDLEELGVTTHRQVPNPPKSRRAKKNYRQTRRRYNGKSRQRMAA